MSKTVQDLRIEDENDCFGDLDKHPSYGMVSISRTTCNPNIPAYGSKIKHNTLITMRVMKSEKNRSAYSDHFFPKDSIVELYFTPAQFAQMVSSMNTSGIPCTLTAIQGEGRIERTPMNDTKREMINDIDRQTKQLRKVIYDLSKEANEIISKKGTMKKNEKQYLSSLLLKISYEIGSNSDFLHKCQKEKLEDTIAEAQAQVEATISKTISDYGMESIKEKFISLPE